MKMNLVWPCIIVFFFFLIKMYDITACWWKVYHYKKWAPAFALIPFWRTCEIEFLERLIRFNFLGKAVKFCGTEWQLSTLRSLCTVFSWIAFSSQTLWRLGDYVGFYFFKEDRLHRVLSVRAANLTACAALTGRHDSMFLASQVLTLLHLAPPTNDTHNTITSRTNEGFMSWTFLSESM